MMHLTTNEIFELAFMVSDGQKIDESEKLEHLKECDECYGKFCLALAILDSTSDEGFENLAITSPVVENKSETSSVPETLSMIKVVRQKIEEVKSVVMEQINSINAALIFEPTFAFAARGDGSFSKSVVKLEELDDEKTYVEFNADKNKLFVQIDIRNLDKKDIEIFLLFDDLRIKEVPTFKEGNLVKGNLSDIPEGDFKIYIKAE